VEGQSLQRHEGARTTNTDFPFGPLVIQRRPNDPLNDPVI